jgi:hypothetical protein
MRKRDRARRRLELKRERLTRLVELSADDTAMVGGASGLCEPCHYPDGSCRSRCCN